MVQAGYKIDMDKYGKQVGKYKKILKKSDTTKKKDN